LGNVKLIFWDYFVIAIYFLALIAMSVYMKLTKKAGTDTESYFLAGRKIPGWLNGISYAATCLNSDVAPAYCGMTVISGVFIYWWYISRFGLALLIGAILFAAFWRKLNIVTSPQFYEIRFSGKAATAVRSWVSLRSIFISVVAWTGAGLLGMQKIAEPLLGWNIWTTFAVVIPIILFYVLLSGYLGVVVSDFFQTLVIIISSFMLMFLVLNEFGGAEGFLHGASALKTALANQFGDKVLTWYPPASHEFLGIIGLFAWTIGTSVGYGGDVAPMSGAMEGQRILSCKNSREASKMYIWAEIGLFLMLSVITLPALGAMVKWPGLYDGSINKELAYGMLLNEYLPSGLLGLAISGVFASVMSTISSNMNFGGQVFINDIYKRFRTKTFSEGHYLVVGRIIAALIVVLAVIVATTSQNVIDIAVFMLGLSSAELTANWAQWWWWRFNSKARLTASFGGPFIFLFNKYIVFEYLIDAGRDTTYIIVLTSIALTFICWVVVALLTKPEPEELLIEFYKRARPMGWWGDIPAKAGIHKPEKGKKIAAGLIIAVLGALTVAAGVICFNNLYVANWSVSAFSAVICIVLAALFKKYFNIYADKNE
jgi:Na+/proline symporter